MTTLIVTVHIIACIALIVLVLLQSGKEGMGVIFGGGSQSMFGSTGAGGLLVKLSALFGAVFLITSLTYNYFSALERNPETRSIMMNVQTESAAPAPEKAEPKPEKTVEFEEAAKPADTAKPSDEAKPSEAASADTAKPVEEKAGTESSAPAKPEATPAEDAPKQ